MAQSKDGGTAALEAHARKLGRKTTALEVNELVLRRRCASLEESAAAETAVRVSVERAMVESEATAKARILYLEEWKLGAAEKLERQAAALETTRSAREFNVVARDLEALREDYLALLSREADARLKAHAARALAAKVNPSWFLG